MKTYAFLPFVFISYISEVSTYSGGYSGGYPEETVPPLVPLTLPVGDNGDDNFHPHHYHHHHTHYPYSDNPVGIGYQVDSGYSDVSYHGPEGVGYAVDSGDFVGGGYQVGGD